MKKRTTKSALLTSVLALLTCFAMLIGTTFAWFTDSVSSVNNIITSGNLDVEMEWADGTQAVDTAAWTNADGSVIFDYDLWEPGYAEVRHIRISNKGTLALKYQLAVYAVGEVSALADAIDVYYLDPAQQIGDRTALTDDLRLGSLREVMNGFTSTAAGNLAAGDSDTVTIALKMRESAGNEYQGLALGSGFTVSLYATQDTVEADSFDELYDKDATADVWDGTTVDTSWYDETADSYEIGTAAQLAGLSAITNAKTSYFENKTVYLTQDIDLGGHEWTPFYVFSGTFEGQGHTVSNFEIDDTDNTKKWACGFFRWIYGSVNDLSLETINATTDHYFGAFAGKLGKNAVVDNCSVSNVHITTTDVTSRVAGFTFSAEPGTCTNCSVTNLTIDATDLAAESFVAGFAAFQKGLTLSGCSVTNFKAEVNGDESVVAGFLGQTQTAHDTSYIKGCTVTGLDLTVSGDAKIGGFIGKSGSTTIASDCSVSGKIDAKNVTSSANCIGGFAANYGWNYANIAKHTHRFTNCSADVDIITGGAVAGGFLGSGTTEETGEATAIFTDCTVAGTVSGTGTIGFFAGEAEVGEFVNCTDGTPFIGSVLSGASLSGSGGNYVIG